MLGHEILDAALLGRLQYRRVLGLGGADDQIFAHRAAKQHHVLGHAADVAPKIGGIDLAQVGAVDQDRSLGRLVEAQQQLGHRALARADAADQADLFTGLDGEAQALQGLDVLTRIGETEVTEGDLSR